MWKKWSHGNLWGSCLPECGTCSSYIRETILWAPRLGELSVSERLLGPLISEHLSGQLNVSEHLSQVNTGSPLLKFSGYQTTMQWDASNELLLCASCFGSKWGAVLAEQAISWPIVESQDEQIYSVQNKIWPMLEKIEPQSWQRYSPGALAKLKFENHKN